MIPLENIPESGILVVTVQFKGYKDYFQNETRKTLKEAVPKLGKKFDLEITPLVFSLIKTIIDEPKLDEAGKPAGFKQRAGRATGAQYQFGYYDMSPDKFKKIYYELKKLCDGREWKDSIEIMVASNIGGLE